MRFKKGDKVWTWSFNGTFQKWIVDAIDEVENQEDGYELEAPHGVLRRYGYSLHRFTYSTELEAINAYMPILERTITRRIKEITLFLCSEDGIDYAILGEMCDSLRRCSDVMLEAANRKRELERD